MITTIKAVKTCKLIAILGISTGLAVAIGLNVSADIPEEAIVESISHNSAKFFIRTEGNETIPVEVNTAFRPGRDLITKEADLETFAELGFRTSGSVLDFHVIAAAGEEPGIYYFPCQLQTSETTIIGWGLGGDRAKGCEKGVEVRGGRTASQATLPFTVAWLKQLAQAPIRRVSYCNVVGETGVNFATALSGNPCNKALEQCQTAGNSTCETSTQGFWWSNEEQMNATLDCGLEEPFTIEGTGETIVSQVQTLLQNTPGQSGACILHVLRPQDLVIVPFSDEEVASLGNEDIWVETQMSTDGKLEVRSISGGVHVRTGTEPSKLQPVPQGKRLIHPSEEDPISSFNRQESLTSTNAAVLCAFASQEDSNLPEFEVCYEAGYLPVAYPVEFCDTELAYGSRGIYEQYLQMNSNSGELEIEYNMVNIPDQLQLYYENRLIFDTGLTSGTGRISVPYSGISSRIKVVMTGNLNEPDTLWRYKLLCSN